MSLLTRSVPHVTPWWLLDAQKQQRLLHQHLQLIKVHDKWVKLGARSRSAVMSCSVTLPHLPCLCNQRKATCSIGHFGKMAFLQSRLVAFQLDALFRKKKKPTKNPSGIKNSLIFTALTCGLLLRVRSSGGQRAGRYFLRQFLRINELPF